MINRFSDYSLHVVYFILKFPGHAWLKTVTDASLRIVYIKTYDTDVTVRVQAHTLGHD